MRCVLVPLLRRLAGRAGPARRPAPPRRPTVEGLEDRRLLSTAGGLTLPRLLDLADAAHGSYVLLSGVTPDGMPDVVVSSGRTVQVYLEGSDGLYNLAFQTTRSPAARSFFLGVGDLNRDGHTDFVTVSRLGDDHRSVVNVLTENQDGSYKASAGVLSDPAALDKLFTGSALEGSVLWRGTQRPTVVPPGSAALSQVLVPRAAHDAGDDDAPDPAAAPAENQGSPAPTDDGADHGLAAGAPEVWARPEHGSDRSRVDAGTDGGPLTSRPADGSRADTPAADGPAVEGAGGADRLARLAPDLSATEEAGPRLANRAASGPHGGAASVPADEAPTADEAPGLAGEPVAPLDLRPDILSWALGGPAAATDGARPPGAPAGDPTAPAGVSTLGEPAGAVPRRVRLSVGDLENILAQAFYLGTLKQSGASNDPAAALNKIPGDPGLLVADLVQRSSEVFARLVQGFFALFLARAALPGEESGWVNMFLGGQTEEEVLSAFLSTAEFGRRADELIGSGSSDERFIRALYALLLRRAAADAEVSGWLAALPNLGRGGIASFLLRSAEFRSLRITSFYEELLQRPASPSEVASWANSPFDLLTIRAFFEARPGQLSS